MKKTNKKMIAIVLVLALVFGFCSTLICNVSYAANQIIGFTGGTVQGTDTVKYVLNEKNVLIKLKNGENFENLRVNNEVTVAEFEYDDSQRNNYAFSVQSEDLVTVQIAGQNYLPDENGLISFSNITATGIQVGGVAAYVAPTTVQVQFDNATINGNSITFAVDDKTNVTATVAPVQTGKATWNGSKLEIVESELNNVQFTLGDTFDSSKMQVVLNGSNNYKETLNVSGDKKVNLGGLTLPNDGVHFGIEMKSGSGSGSGSNTAQFDGNAYFVWLNSDNTISYHKFTGIGGAHENQDHFMEYVENYFTVAQLTDQSANNKTYTWGQENANWVLAKDLEDGEGNIIPERLTKLYIFGDGTDKDHGVQLDPCGADDGANSICTFGDRNFRATIYREGYNAIQFSSTQAEYTYFPSYWNPTFFSSIVDISESTAEKPAVYNTYLLEPNIKFKSEAHSAMITKVEALNINPEAVEIQTADGNCTITFKSNFYDSVVFKVTAGGRDYYIKINRLVINTHDTFAPDRNDAKVVAELFYPTSKSYSNFDVMATIVNKDGTSETKKVSANKITLEDPNDADRLINDYTLDGGKGLYASQFSVDVNKTNIKAVYFTVLNKGALDGDKFGGTFSGSGNGTCYNAETRRVEL